MEKYSIPAGGNQKIALTVSGNLVYKGWDRPEVEARGSSSENLSLEENDGVIRVECRSDCTVQAPRELAVDCQSIGGDATFKSLDGELTVAEVSGSLNLRAVGATNIDTVRGSLYARDISGNLRVASVYGGITAVDIQGDFEVADSCYGSLTLDDLGGNASASVQGNVTLRLDPTPGREYSFASRGNLICRIPKDSSAVVKVSSAGSLSVHHPQVEKKEADETELEFVLGDGGARLTLSAEGNLTLSSMTTKWDWGDFDFELDEDLSSTIGEQVSEQIEAQLEMVEQQLEAQLESLATVLETSGLSAEKAERIAERARQASERASQRAQDKINRAQEKLQRKLEAARRRAERKARAAEHAARDRRRRPETFQWETGRAASATGTAEVEEPVTDEERMLILQMLEKEQISAAEAEKLLAALEGGGS